MSYTAIMKVNPDTNRVEKYQDFPTQDEAEAHVQKFISDFPLAYSTPSPDNRNTDDWLCDTSAKTIAVDVVVDPDAFNKKRRVAYGEAFSVGDQLDMMWHDKKDGTTTWEDAIQAIKDANPKT
tara:strand:- start:87 stop:455 length:369 start_codon:yes stop_codon:yes gene_type:complete